MAILIVDDEAKTREAIRNLLGQLGHRVILDAKNGEEAVRIADYEKVRIEMMIVDLDMTCMDGLAFAEKIAERTILDLAPFLLITSELSRSKWVECKKKNPRLDSHLVKPFRMTALAQAMNEAYKQRCSTRDRILYIGNSTTDLIQNALTFSPFRSLQTVASIQDWNTFVEQKSQVLGAVMIHPKDLNEEQRVQLSMSLTSFKKTPLGSIIPFICLSNDPAETFHFRTICQIFTKKIQTQQEWTELLRKLEGRVFTSWELNLLFQETKLLVHKKKLNSAWKLAEKMIKLDPYQSDVHILIGEILEGLNRKKDAIRHYEEAIELNPTLPRPYIRLLKLLEKKPFRTESVSHSKIDLGTLYCPQNSDLLLTTAEFYIKAEEYGKSKNLLEAVLKLNTGHETAQRLLNSLPC